MLLFLQVEADHFLSTDAALNWLRGAVVADAGSDPDDVCDEQELSDEATCDDNNDAISV